MLDRDGNGFISKQELGMAMRSLGYMPSEVELAIIMQRLDMDGECSPGSALSWGILGAFPVLGSPWIPIQQFLLTKGRVEGSWGTLLSPHKRKGQGET